MEMMRWFEMFLSGWRYSRNLHMSVFTVLFLWVSLQLDADAQCPGQKVVYQPGERVYYNAYYNWNFIWINAGEVVFSVDSTRWRDQPGWHFKAYGKTYKAYDLFFKVRDTFEVWAHPLTQQPFEFERKTREGSYSSYHRYLFDAQAKSIYTQIQKEGAAYVFSTIPWPPCTYDLLSMVYQARNIDFSKYKKDEKIPIRMVVDGEIHDLYIRYLGVEDVKTRDGRKYRCLKFSPLLMKGTIFEAGEDMTVWVTDDKSRVPVIVEAKVLVGSVKAVLTGTEGLKYPVTAEILK